MTPSPFLDSGRSSPTTLEALDAAFRPSLERYFGRRVKNRGEIDDLVQEVFLRLLRRSDLGGIEKLGGYVFETASSVLIDAGRRARVRHEQSHGELDQDAVSDVDFSPERVLLGRERLALATTALLELPDRTRVIFVLRRLEGLKLLEIATRLGISVSAVEKHMMRAMTHLMNRLGDD